MHNRGHRQSQNPKGETKTSAPATISQPRAGRPASSLQKVCPLLCNPSVCWLSNKRYLLVELCVIRTTISLPNVLSLLTIWDPLFFYVLKNNCSKICKFFLWFNTIHHGETHDNTGRETSSSEILISTIVRVYNNLINHNPIRNRMCIEISWRFVTVIRHGYLFDTTFFFPNGLSPF
jgi:hypothetical protein